MELQTFLERVHALILFIKNLGQGLAPKVC